MTPARTVASAPDAIDRFLASYLDRAGVPLDLPSGLRDGANRLLEGRMSQSVEALTFPELAGSGDELTLRDILCGWSLTNLRRFGQAAQYLESAADRARGLGSESGHAMAAAVLGTTRLFQGREDEGFRLLAEAAATSVPSSPARFFALIELGRTLTFNRMTSAAETVLDEAISEGPWPVDAHDRLMRWVARLRIETGDLDEARAILKRIPATATTDTDRAVDAVARARFHAAADDPAAARSELHRASALLAGVGVLFLQHDYLETEIRVDISAGRHDEAAHKAIAAFRNSDMRGTAYRVLSLAIEALTLAGEIEQAWKWSNHSLALASDHEMHLATVFDLQIEVNDARMRRRVAEEIEQRNATLRELEARAAAVLAALAHGVRDPLTVLHLWLERQGDRGLLEPSTAAESEPAERSEADAKVYRSAAAAIERLERLLEQIVWLARLRQFQVIFPTPSSDVDTVGLRAVERVRAWARNREIQVHHRTAGSSDAIDLSNCDGLQALADALVLHSSAYAAAGGQMTLAIESNADGVWIAVEDDGPLPLSTTDQARTGVAPGLNSRRVAGGDATGDIALLVAQGLAAAFRTQIDLTTNRAGRAVASVRIRFDGTAPIETRINEPVGQPGRDDESSASCLP